MLRSFELDWLGKESVRDFPTKSKGVPREAEVAQGVPGRLRPPDFLDVSALQGW